jgi:predicted MFS family arabinose efflux permease
MAPPPLPAPRLLTHISLIGFATALSARAVDPIIVPIAQGLGEDPGKVALLSTAFALPFALVQPILGPVADMIGKVRLMIICLVVMIAASFACAAATSFTALLVARVVVGMATGGIFPVGLAIIGDEFPVKDRQIAIARWLAIVIGGNLLGAAFAGAIGDLLGWRAVFLGIAFAGAAVFVDAMFSLRQAARAHAANFDWRAVPAGYRAIFTNPLAKFCFLAVFLEGIAIFGLFPFVALLLHATGETRASIAGLVISGFSIGGIVYSFTVRYLIGRFRPRDLMIGGGLVVALAFAGIATDPAWPLQFAAFAFVGFGFYMLHGCIQVEATELSAIARGAATSLHSLFFFLGHASGPVLYGYGFAHVGASRSVLLGGVLVFLVGLMCARYLRRQWMPT